MSVTEFKDACERLRCNDPTFVSLKDDFYRQYIHVLFGNPSHVRLFTSSLAENTLLEQLSLDGALLFTRPGAQQQASAAAVEDDDDDLDLVILHIQRNNRLQSLRLRWCTQARLMAAIGTYANVKSVELVVQRPVSLEPLLNSHIERIRVEGKSQISGMKPLVQQNQSRSLRDLCVMGRMSLDDFECICESVSLPQSRLTNLRVMVDSQDKSVRLGKALQSPICCLTHLDLTQSRLDDTDSARALLDGLALNTSLQGLNLTKCNLGHSPNGLDVTSWSSCFEQNQTLRSLNLSWNFLQKSSDAALLSLILPKCVSLREINLKWNLVSDEDCLSWCRNLLPAMHTVRLSAMALPDAQAASMFGQAILHANSKLRILEVGRLWFTQQEKEGMQVIREALSNTNNRLEHLSMENFGHAPEQVRDLLEGLALNTSLRYLTLLDSKYHPSICDKALCHLLETNTSISHLEIGKNEQFTASTVQSMAEGLRSNRHLKRLRVCQCPQLDDWSVLFDSLQENTTLEVLDIQNGPFHGNTLFEQVTRALPRILGLKQLLFSGPGDYEPIVADAAEFLNALEVNTSLERINVSLPSVGQAAQMKLWLQLNKAGRRILRHAESIPLGLWSHIYARAMVATPADAGQAYYLLRQGLVSHHPCLGSPAC